MRMPNRLIPCAALAALCLAAAAHAQPTTVLKMWFFTSESSASYQCHAKLFVDAINNDRDDSVRVNVTFGTGIRPLEDQLKPILEGSADITTITPTYAPTRFRNNAVLQLPGLFASQLEGMRVYKELVDSDVLDGYQDLFPLGTFLSLGESIHSRKPTTQLADLRGQNIRVNNDIEALVLKRLGANPVFLPINQTMDGLGQGTVDAVTLPTAVLLDFGIGRMTVNHFLLPIAPVSTVVTMTQVKFSSLPPRAQDMIRRHIGSEWAQHAAACMDARDRDVTARLEADARRKVAFPTPADVAAAEKVFATVIQEWTAQNPANKELLAKVKGEIAKVSNSAKGAR